MLFCFHRYHTGRLLITAILTILMLFSVSGCTVKRAPIQPGIIPKLVTPTPADEEFGERLFNSLRDDYKLDSNNQRNDQLSGVLNRLTKAAEVDHIPWHLHLFIDPDIMDIRAVHGNYIFVWSGLLDVFESEDELAAILACELAHVLAHHTYPVQFNIWSDVLFDVAELATSIAIMTLSQGTVAIQGHGWMKWAYVEVADLDPLDRKYSEAYEREAATIALLILTRSKYSSEAMIQFWKRVAKSDTLQNKSNRLNRSLSPQQRVQMLEDLLENLPSSANQLHVSKIEHLNPNMTIP